MRVHRDRAKLDPGANPEWTVGVISDTHGLLRPEVLTALKGSDYIIHAGDIGAANIVEELSAIAPLTAVRGNVERGKWASRLPETAVFQIGAVSIYVLHDLNQLDLSPKAAKFAAVISGHSHCPSQQFRDGVLYFNPGSAGSRRFHLPVTVGKLRICGLDLQGEIITLFQ